MIIVIITTINIAYQTHFRPGGTERGNNSPMNRSANRGGHHSGWGRGGKGQSANRLHFLLPFDSVDCEYLLSHQ